MRALSATLTAAQQQPSTVPHVQVKLSDRITNVVRLRWERYYTGSEPDGAHDAAVDSDGTLHRLRYDPDGTPSLQYSRVTDPDENSDYSSWTNVTTNVLPDDVSIAAAGLDVWRVFIDSADAVRLQKSTDGGATFGSFETIASGLTDVTQVAIAIKDEDSAVCFFVDNGDLYHTRWNGSTWSTPASWGETANSFTGLTAVHVGDYHLAIAGTDGDDNPRLWTAIFGDGAQRPADVWSALYALAESDAGSGVSFKAPFLSYVDVHRLFFIEAYTGDVAYSQPHRTWFPAGQSFDANAWHEPIPFDLESDPGMAPAGDGTHAWLTTPDGVWHASMAWTYTELTDDVLELSIEQHRDRGRLTLSLRNDDGRYNDLPNGAYSDIRPGAQLEVRPGLVTGEGAEVCSPPLVYWIDGWEHTTSGGEATLVLRASDGLALIERWRARRQHTWAAGDKNVSQIVAFVCGRAGLELLNVGSSTLSGTLKPDFTIHPGENGRRVLQRLLAQVPDLLRVSYVDVYLTEPEDDDSSVYEYGAGHAIYRARFASGGLATNRVQVFGDGVVAQEFDWPDIEDQHDRLLQVFDLNATTQTKAEDRAALTLRKESLDLPRGEIVTPAHCGQELNDVVTVTDGSAGITEQDFRVAGVELRYARGRARYEQRLLLAEV